MCCRHGRLYGFASERRNLTPLQVFAADTPKAFASGQPPLQVFLGEREAFNRLAGDESIHNLGNVRDRDAPVKKVIRFD